MVKKKVFDINSTVRDTIIEVRYIDLNLNDKMYYFRYERYLPKEAEEWSKWNIYQLNNNDAANVWSEKEGLIQRCKIYGVNLYELEEIMEAQNYLLSFEEPLDIL